MPNIAIFSGAFCNRDRVIGDIVASTGCRLVTEEQVTDEAAGLSGMPKEKISRAFSARTSVFNRFTREKESAVAFIRQVMGEMLAGDHILFAGFPVHLIPPAISHVLKVCLIADLNFRVALACESRGCTEKEALKKIRSRDEDCASWVHYLHGRRDPWHAELYDMVIPMDKTGVERAGALIEENLLKEVVRPTARSRQAAADFRLSAQVQVALVREGHDVTVSAHKGRVTLTINKQVLMLSRLEEELTAIARRVPGAETVETVVGEAYHRSDIYRKHDFELPSRVLLVDDEREFIQTLSERLLLRDMGSAVAYDGESALELVREDAPEVMIIDLKMPGISGLEVLEKVKAIRPEVEVIVLTGHGADKDKDRCLELGAFAYLQKPVDIEDLSAVLKRAHEKIRAGRRG